MMDSAVTGALGGKTMQAASETIASRHRRTHLSPARLREGGSRRNGE